jgi:pimeloyl-ACP methyl ester carboxylesterase
LKTRLNRNIKRTILFLSITLLTYDCGSSDISQYPEPKSTAVNGSFISNEGTFEFGEKEYSADYGTISVLENRRNPESRLIHLPVIRIRASIENINEPVFGLAGGPGQSNLIFHPVDSLLYDHDFVIVGYRGVDGSTVLDCPEVTEAIENTSEDLLSEESLKQIGQAWESSFDRLRSTGIDLNGYNIVETIEDMEAVRKAFNYNRINLISESYGTRIAYLYGVIHPQFIHRSVMIGVNPPGGFVWDPRRTDELIKYYSCLWEKDSVMSLRCSDLAGTMQRVLKNMPGKWLFFSIDPGRVKMATFGMLFHRNTAAIVFDSFIAAEKGDNSGLALMSIAFDYVTPYMVWGDAAAKAVSADLDYWNRSSDMYEDKNLILGSPLTEFYWKPLKYGNLGIEMIPESLRVPVKSDVETLLLSGSVDFTNPPECATELLSYLKNGRQIIISEAGHVGDIRYLQLDATKGLIADYINKGIVDTSKIKYVPMDFNVKWGFPAIAKTGIGLVGIVVLLLAAGIVWIL